MKKLMLIVGLLLTTAFYLFAQNDCEIDIGSGNNLCETNEAFSADITWSDSGDDIVRASELESKIYVGKEILIDADFIVDVNYFLLINCTIQVSSGFGITIEKDLNDPISHQLRLVNCDIYSCNEMWAGITAERGTGFYMINSQIEDAERAVFSTGARFLWSIDNAFNRNIFGIVAIGPRVPTDDYFFNLRIEGCTFETSSTLTSIAEEHPWFEDDHRPEASLAGIVLAGIKYANIGNPNGDVNVFQNIYNGIYTDRVNLNIVNSRFEDVLSASELVAESTYPTVDWSTNNGVSLRVRNGKLKFEGLGIGESDDNTFENCVTGIQLERSGGSIVDSRFLNSTNGILGSDLPFNVLIEDNVMDYTNFTACSAMSVGVQLEKLYNESYIVRDNEIGVGGSSTTDEVDFGIRVFDFAGDDVQVEINSNEIVVDRSGIQVFNSVPFGDNVSISYNDVEVPDQNGDHAIHIDLFEGNDLFVSHNRPSGGEDVDYGILVSSVLNGYYCDNTFTGADVGFQFEGMCNGTRFIANDFDGHDIGLSYIEAETDDQFTILSGSTYVHGNTWTGSYDSHGARWIATDLSIEQSDYWVNTNTSSNQLPPKIHGYTNWFTDQMSYTSLSCATLTVKEDTVQEFNLIDSLIAIDTASYSNAAKRWNFMTYLFRKINKKPNIKTSNQLFDDFYDDVSVSVIDSFYDVEVLIGASLDLKDSDRAELGIIEDSIEYFTSLLTSLAIDTIYNLDTSIFNSTGNDKVDTFNTYFKKISEFDSSFQLWDSLMIKRSDSLLSTAAEHLAVISADENYEKNQKYVLEQLIDYLGSSWDTFATNDLELLDSLAEECPNEQGNAVYIARAIMSRIDSIEYNFCLPQNGQASKYTPSSLNFLS